MTDAVEEFKLQMAEFPLVPGGVVPPMFRWERGVVPSAFCKLIAEVVERLEALEATDGRVGELERQVEYLMDKDRDGLS